MSVTAGGDERRKKKGNQIWDGEHGGHFMPGGQDGVLSTGAWKGGWQRARQEYPGR